MAEWSELNPLERLPNRLRKSPYTVAVSEPLTEAAMAYFEATLNVADQFFVPTATWGLTEWERLVGITPAAGASLAARRREVIAKLCSTGTTNAEMIRALAEALTGYGAKVTENFGGVLLLPALLWGDGGIYQHRRRPAHAYGGGDQAGPPALCHRAHYLG